MKDLQSDGGVAASDKCGSFHAQIVDLNNFSSFPTLAVGLLTASLRQQGHRVSILCPLDHGVPASEREWQERRIDDVARRVHLSTSAGFRWVRDTARKLRNFKKDRPDGQVLRRVRDALDTKPDILLISAYLQHFLTVQEVGKMCRDKGVPFLLGGPMFNITDTAEAWLDIPGLVAIVGAEADQSISGLIETALSGGDLLEFPGVMLPDGRRSAKAAPLRNLDLIPFPDFRDFPWERYRNPIIPMMTGRGCQWSKCVFCSDIVSTSGRTFRSRSIENVLLEMEEQSRRHGSKNFLFLDLKLNSWPDMFRALAEETPRIVPGAEWVGTIHVDERADNGLSGAELRAAARGGMRRISFGLESGSQRLLDSMKKGSSVEGNSKFIRQAYEAGLSVRCTMFKGFPGETAEDMEMTAEFLEQHAKYLDRVRFNEFNLLEDTPIYTEMFAAQGDAQALTHLTKNSRIARADYRNTFTEDRAYCVQKSRALRTVFAINRRPVRSAARQFDGLM